MIAQTVGRVGSIWKLGSPGAPALCFVHGIAAYDGPHDLDVLDLFGVDRVWVIGEHDEVRQLSRRDRALDILLFRRIRAVNRVHTDRILHADLLIRTPDLAVPTLPRDHSLDAHQRRKRTRAEV